MATLALVPKPSMALYELEDRLVALVDSAETILPEQETEYLADLQTALDTTVEKRDRVGQFMAHLESQAQCAAAEIKRLQERKDWFERALERMEGYVIRIIESFGADAKGKYRKLEGKTITFSLRACPASVEVTEEIRIPLACKTATVKVPAAEWEAFLDTLDLETRGKLLASAAVTYAVSKTEVKKLFDQQATVDGADLKIGKHSLVRK